MSSPPLLRSLAVVSVVAGLAMCLSAALSSAGGAATPAAAGVRAVLAAPDEPPVADLVLNPSTGTAPLTSRADASGSTDDVEITSYAVTWGDGTRTGPQPEAVVSHVYTAPGSYFVKLTVQDAGRRGASTTSRITVNAPPAVPPADAAPLARVRVAPSGTADRGDITVDAGASTDDTGITGYAFDFGDGSRTASQPASTVRHHYLTPGTYTIRLTVTDAGGSVSTATTTTTVTSTSTSPVAPTVKPTVVSLTFDDTNANQVDAATVLNRYDMDATFFVNAPRIGTSGHLSKAQVDALVAAGHEIGGHTLNHVDLTTTSTSETTRQVCDDRSRLIAMGYRVSSFAYPFGATSSSVKQVVESCGYRSARGIGNLRSPGYGCTSCPTAESIPPIDRWQIRTPASVKSDTTVSMLENYVTQAENDRGGWVPLVFHNVCSGCSTYAVDLRTFTAFADWLSRRPGTTVVRTVDQVISGTSSQTPAPSPSTTPSTVSPSTSESASPAPTGNPVAATVGGSTHVINGTNIYRSTNYLVRYTPARGATTGTNQYGTEIAVVDGTITRIETSVGNMAIPVNGYVLSGHGDANTWLRTYARVGGTVRLEY